jgi:hypothetical protein
MRVREACMEAVARVWGQAILRKKSRKDYPALIAMVSTSIPPCGSMNVFSESSPVVVNIFVPPHSAQPESREAKASKKTANATVAKSKRAPRAKSTRSGSKAGVTIF